MLDTPSSSPLALLSEARRRILGLLRRRDRTVGELAADLGVTGNAVRGHLAALEAAGLIAVGPARRDGARKPARLYRLAPAGEELFPRGYARLSAELLDLLVEWDGKEGAAEVMREVGGRLGGGAGGPGGAVRALRAHGGAVAAATGGGELALAGCPLSATVAARPGTCALMAALVGGAASVVATERCDHSGGRDRCRFALAQA